MNAFRPYRSSRFWRFTPRVDLQVCCTLHPALGFKRFRLWPRSRCVSAPFAPPVTPHACLHTLRSLSLVDSRLASPRCLSLSPLPSHTENRCRRPRPQGLTPSPSPSPSTVLPQFQARCSLGLCSSSRCSLHPECSSEPPRGAFANANPPWPRSPW